MAVKVLRRLFTVLLLAAVALRVQADAVSDLPEGLAGRLQPVAEVSLDTLDTDAREQLAQARQLVVDNILQHHTDAELAEAYGELAALYQVQHVYTAADLCYRNARILAPDRFRWTYLHAYLAALNGETAQAIERYEQARRLRPDYLAVTLRLADAWLDLNEQDKALAAYRQVENERGLEAAAIYGLGQIALLQRRFPEAVERFKQVLALQPEASRVHYSLAQALLASGREAEARQHLQQLGDRLPVITDPLVDGLQSLQRGSRVYFSRAMKASKKHDYASARADFARGLEREPENIEARISYARTLYLTDAGREAGQQLDEVLDRAPDNTLALFLRGVLAEEAGEMDDALEYYRRVIAREPGHPGANFYLANHFYRNGDPASAVRHYAATLAGDPENFNAYLPYAGALMQTGHAAGEILAVIETARNRFPDQPVLQYLHIQLLACPDAEPACDPDRALAEATALVEAQALPPHRELLALAHAASGDYDEAASLQEAVISDAVWTMPMEIERLRRGLSAYRNGKIPSPDDLFTRYLLQAPQTRAADVFRDYPTPKPY